MVYYFFSFSAYAVLEDLRLKVTPKPKQSVMFSVHIQVFFSFIERKHRGWFPPIQIILVEIILVTEGQMHDKKYVFSLNSFSD